MCGTAALGFGSRAGSLASSSTWRFLLPAKHHVLSDASMARSILDDGASRRSVRTLVLLMR